MLRRIGVATIALAVGVAAAGALLAYSGSVGGGQIVLAAARDLPAGAALTADAIRPVTAALGPPQAAAAFAASDRRLLLGTRARHDLVAGQLIQRGDVEAAGGEGAEALVAVPVKDLPPVKAGDRVDLFALVGSGDHVAAEPVAWAVPVAAVTSAGLVLRVGQRQELAFVYSAGTMRLAAAVSGAPAPPPAAAPITSPEQALEAAR